MLSLKLQDTPIISKLEYAPLSTYQLIPDYSVDNSNNEVIAHALVCMYQPPQQRINLSKLSYTLPPKAYFDILLQQQGASFYLTVPEEYADLVESKMETVWSKSEIRNLGSILVDGFELDKAVGTIASAGKQTTLNDFAAEKTEVCELILKDFNFKSLNTSKSDLYPLTNMLGILKLLRPDEKVRVSIAIEPIKRMNWVSMAKDEYDSFKKGKTVNNEMSTKEKMARLGFNAAEVGINLYIDYKLLFFESVFGLVMPDKKEDEKQKIEIKIDSLEVMKEENMRKGLLPATVHKMTAEAFRVKISILSESPDKNRAKLNMLAVANAYKDLSGDNELVARFLTASEQQSLFEQVKNFCITTSKKCICSDREVAKLIQLPQADLQREYKLESIDTREVDIPPELQNGPVVIGIAEKQGKQIKATWAQDKNIRALAKLFCGPQASGKTTAIKRTARDFHRSGDAIAVIDYVESNEMAREIAASIPAADRVMIELGGKRNIPALAFNEVSRLITENMDPWERVRLANLLAAQVEYLINAVTDDSTGDLTAPMLRYLHSASMVTFIRPGAKVADVFDILRRWDKRNETMRYAKASGCFDADDDVFFDLEELHERDKTGKIIGTRENLIIGITNRITILKKDPYLKAMLKAEIDPSQDFTGFINEGKAIFVIIPQYLFPDPMVRDILTTFFISRIWLTVQLRTNNHDARLCHVIFDEVHQVPTTAKFISNHVTEFRRHRLGLILSCHYFKQLGHLLDALKSSGVSYVLIAGTEKENLEKLKEELSPFSVEEGLSLKKYHSLNIINYGNQYAKFITDLTGLK